jgi:hypothetical protein
VVCFRLEPPGLSEERCDLLNEQIVEAVNAGGDAARGFELTRGMVAEDNELGDS